MNITHSEATEIGKDDGRSYGAAVKREGVDTSTRFFFHELALKAWWSAPVANRSYAARSAYIQAFKETAALIAA